MTVKRELGMTEERMIRFQNKEIISPIMSFSIAPMTTSCFPIVAPDKSGRAGMTEEKALRFHNKEVPSRAGNDDVKQ